MSNTATSRWQPFLRICPFSVVVCRSLLIRVLILLNLLVEASSFAEYLLVCLFVCLGFHVPPENISLTWKRYHYRWRASNFDLYSAVMAMQFFSVPHLLWHGSFVYNGHLRCQAFGSGAVTTCYYYLDLRVSRLGFEHPTFRDANALTNYAPPRMFVCYKIIKELVKN